jgi:restriction system protein
MGAGENMSLWMVRAGKHGEHESKFLDEERVYLTWESLNRDLSKLSDRNELISLLADVYAGESLAWLRNNAAQIWTFAKRMQKGDWIGVPSKKQPTFNIAEITGDYVFDPQAQDPYYHWRSVHWVGRDVPRTAFGQDLLYSFGAIMTICQIERNDAERRVREMASRNWAPETSDAVADPQPDASEAGEGVDLEELARDQVARLIIQKFKGHSMERLVEAVLKAQGYTTYHSPMGPDKGVDLLASPGALGFGHPRICVQVKSGDGPVDHPTLSQLLGTMHTVQADQGVLVAWGGFKQTVQKETAQHFFRVRLWGQSELISQILEHYDRLDEDVRAELPLKRIWMVAAQDGS